MPWRHVHGMKVMTRNCNVNYRKQWPPNILFTATSSSNSERNPARAKLYQSGLKAVRWSFLDKPMILFLYFFIYFFNSWNWTQITIHRDEIWDEAQLLHIHTTHSIYTYMKSTALSLWAKMWLEGRNSKIDDLLNLKFILTESKHFLSLEEQDRWPGFSIGKL